MTADNRGIETIFSTALQCQSPAQRVAYLREACAGNAELQDRVEALLRAHDHAGHFLDAPDTVTLAQNRPTHEKPGTIIGPYKLLEQIGEGGFGVVYMAEQERPIRRKVALKIIKPGMDTRQVIARFEAERQALALMDHPNIAKVFDAGETAAGRPYFVMELVRGIPITTYCDQAKLALRERLELFVHVCQAVQHAHHKGIVHRDIKPSNILVTLHDGTPVVKVIDFGIAKAMAGELTDKTMFTGFAQVMGTPLYASPEQVALSGLDIDTRTDVYSLGVLLYELLTGNTPFEKERLQKAAYDEMRRIIREEDPPRPSVRMTIASPQTTDIAAQRASQPRRLAQIFRGELDWIVMKALEKDRGRRYDTPLAFAGDIARYLANDPVEARPPSTAYRVNKFVRRHTWGSAVAAAAILILGLSTVLIWHAQRASAAALHDTKIALANLEEQRKLTAERQRDLDEQRRQDDLLQKEAADRQIALLQTTADLEQQRLLAIEAAAKAQVAAERARQLEADAGSAKQTLSEAQKKAQAASTQLTNELVTNLSYQGQRNLDQRRPVEARRALYEGLDLVPQTSLSPLWITAPLLKADALFSRPLNLDFAMAGPTDQATASEIRTFSGHTSGVLVVAFSPDGRMALSGGGDNTLKLWDIATGKEIRTFKGHTNNIWGAAFLPDGHTALSGSEDKTLKLWDVATGKEIRTFTGHTGGVWGIALSPDGHTVLSGSADKTLKLWDIASGTEIRTFKGHTDTVFRLAFSPDGRTALSGAGKADKTLKLWDIASGELIRTFKGHTDSVYNVAFSPDGNTALSCGGSNDATLKLWDITTGNVIRTFKGHSAGILGVAISPDGRTALSGSNDNTLKLWDIASGKEICTLTGHTGWIRWVALAPDGRTALSACDDKTLKLWDIANARDLATATDRATALEIRSFAGHTNEVQSVAISPDGRTALSGSNTLKLWDIVTGKEIRTFKGQTDYVMGEAFSTDGRTALSCSIDQTLKLWDLATGQVIHTFKGHTGSIWGVALAPDGRTAVSASHDKTLKLWDLATGELIRTFTGHAGPVRAVAFAPDGSTVLSASDDRTLKLWDVATGTIIRTFTGHGSNAYAVAFSRDGSTALSGSQDNTVKLWDIATGKAIRTFTGHTKQVLGVAFSPDGRTAVSGSADATLKLWDLATGQEICTLTGHTGWVRAVAFAPDGRAVLSACDDKTVKLWDIAMAKVMGPAQDVKTMPGYGGPVRAVAFAPDGTTILSGSDDKTLKLSDSATGKIIRGFGGHTAAVLGVAFAPDGRTALSGSADKTLKLWDLDTGDEIRAFAGHTDRVQGVALSPDGRTALSASADHTLKLWNLASGKEIRAFTGHTDAVNAVAFSPDGNLALSGSNDKTLMLWDPATGTEIRAFAGHAGAVSAVAFAPDGRTALSGSVDKTLKLWNLATSKEIRTLTGHTAAINAVAFAPDGRTALSGSADKTLKLWDLATGKEICTFTGHTAAINAVAFAPDAHAVLSASDDKTVKLWDFSRAEQYRRFDDLLPAAYAAQAANPDDPAALLPLGQYYAFRGIDSWAADSLEHARKAGGTVSPLLLGQCYWRLKRYPEALTQYQAALTQAEAPQTYLQLCIDALKRAMVVPAAPPTNADIPLTWTLLENGCQTTQTGTAFHVAGTTNQDGYNHWNGAQTGQDYPAGDFTVSVDFKVPNFAGTGGNPLVYLRASTDAENAVGIYYQVGKSGYRLQSWRDTQKVIGMIGPFGDENKTFHRMTLQYDAETGTATGWIDDSRIGEISTLLTGKLQFWLVANTDKAGMNIDLYFDNFTLTPGKILPPAPPTKPTP